MHHFSRENLHVSVEEWFHLNVNEKPTVGYAIGARKSQVEWTTNGMAGGLAVRPCKQKQPVRNRCWKSSCGGDYVWIYSPLSGAFHKEVRDGRVHVIIVDGVVAVGECIVVAPAGLDGYPVWEVRAQLAVGAGSADGSAAAGAAAAGAVWCCCTVLRPRSGRAEPARAARSVGGWRPPRRCVGLPWRRRLQRTILH